LPNELEADRVAIGFCLVCAAALEKSLKGKIAAKGYGRIKRDEREG